MTVRVVGKGRGRAGSDGQHQLTVWVGWEREREVVREYWLVTVTTGTRGAGLGKRRCGDETACPGNPGFFFFVCDVTILRGLPPLQFHVLLLDGVLSGGELS